MVPKKFGILKRGSYSAVILTPWLKSDIIKLFFSVIQLFKEKALKCWTCAIKWCDGIQHNDIQHNGNLKNGCNRHSTQHYNIQHNDTKHNDTKHNDTKHNDIQHNDTQHNNKKVRHTAKR